MKQLRVISLFSVLSFPLITNTFFIKHNIEKTSFKILMQKAILTSSKYDNYVQPNFIKPLNIDFEQKPFILANKLNTKGWDGLEKLKFYDIAFSSNNEVKPYTLNLLKINDYAKSFQEFKQKYTKIKFDFAFQSDLKFYNIIKLELQTGYNKAKSETRFSVKLIKNWTKPELLKKVIEHTIAQKDLTTSNFVFDWTNEKEILIPFNDNQNSFTFKLRMKLVENDGILQLESTLTGQLNKDLIEPELSPEELIDLYGKSAEFFIYSLVFMLPISLTSEFADKEEVREINNNLENLKNYSIDMTNQDTHTDISNNIIKNKNNKTDSKYRNKTNKEYIEEEVRKIITKAFTIKKVDLWDKKYKHKMKYDIEFQPTANRIKIFFKDINPDKESYASRFYNNLLIQINLTFHPEFFQKNIQNRLTITPSQILDPKTNKLILDQPEVEVVQQNGQVKSQIFWYHNTVKIEFRAVDGTEQLLVENQPTEVYNNIYFKTLVDKRFLKTQNETTSAESIDDIKKGLIWNVSVNQKDKSNPIDIKIGVKSINPNLSFKWKGWNPENDPSKPEQYQQYKLITPQIDNKQNPDFDRTINPKTGTRKEIIWVNSDVPVKNFYQDPYDKKDTLSQTGSLANYGYIAEASVVNSGANYLFNDNDPSGFNGIKSAVSDLNKWIGKIEINRYSDNFTHSFKEVNNDRNDALEKFSFSIPGIYHYNIPIKDFVKTQNTFDPTKIQSKNINPEVGSSLHKYLIINNNKDKYQSFLKIYGDINAKKSTKDNIPKIQSFWGSPAGQHLKFFLIHNQLIKSSFDIEKYSYEEIVSLWNYYVSVVKQGTIVLPHGVSRTKSLFDIQFNAIKIKANNKSEAINLIKQEALKQIQRQTKNNQISLSDFEIIDVDSLNWNNFLDINNTNQQMSIRLVANPTSVFLSESSLNILVLNSNNFGTNTNDLFQMNFNNLTYNFSDYTKQQNNEDEKKRQEKFVNNFITNHIHKTIRLHRQKDNDIAIQNADYEIYINKHKITQFNFTFGFSEQDLVDNIIKKFFEALKTKSFAQLEIEIKSIETSFKLKGSNSYLITHSSNANKAPEAPEPFNWAEENNTLIDDSNPEKQNYFDLLLLKIGDWIGDFSKWTFEEFEKTIINDTIIKRLIEQSKKPVELNKDFIIRINDNLYNKEVITDFFKTKGKLKITIQSILDLTNREKVLINYRNIFLHNTLDGKKPEELAPNIPNKPNNDDNSNSNNTSNNSPNEQNSQKSKTNKTTVVASIVGFLVLGITTFGIIVRWRTRKL
ncbi:Mbov_0399 family ICE element protein [Mycoplasma capricolum]|uniref:Mbov_0399 family ICE element protein n=1 Tax=Mycoplasma capricolum TaxID=2095 RepID=UPI003DA334B5